ncbi:nuclear transport factor 2 family protein [Longimicrobium sp.]|jgi:hypothetical protein|uniref:nuclear transport factor 2 family protein n=1 Tax=Longimicrobium sp. TaxID=2029185 RepID=UPI002F945210
MNASIGIVGVRRGIAAGAAALVLGVAGCSSSGAAPAGTAPGPVAADQAVVNATNFHLLDFVAWNNRDVDMFRRLHTADVKVEFAGARTEGIDAHVHALQPMWQPGSQLTNHAPVVAEGEWTCMVGTSAPPANMKMVTVARWRGGAISEEYILVKMLPPGTPKPAVSGSPVASITNRRPEMKALVGAEPGWSCTLERTAGGSMVISLRTAGGAAAEQMIFTQ